MITGIDKTITHSALTGAQDSVVLNLWFEEDGSFKNAVVVSGPANLRDQALAVTRHAHREITQPHKGSRYPTEVWIVFRRTHQTDTSATIQRPADPEHDPDRGPLIVVPTVSRTPISKQREISVVAPQSLPPSTVQLPKARFQGVVVLSVLVTPGG